MVTRSVALLVLLVLVLGCSKENALDNESTPVVVLGVSERGSAQLDYVGPDSMSLRYSHRSFTFQLGNWCTADGEIKSLSDAKVQITVRSKSDRPYDIQVLGLSSSADSKASEEQLKETLHVEAGERELKIDRFIVYTYDFAAQ